MTESTREMPSVSMSPDVARAFLEASGDKLLTWAKTMVATDGRMDLENVRAYRADLRAIAGVLLSLVDSEG